MWISQLVALLDKGEGAAIHDILISLAKDYPQALYYPFKISSCNFKFESTEEGRANQEAVAKYVRFTFAYYCSVVLYCVARSWFMSMLLLVGWVHS